MENRVIKLKKNAIAGAVKVIVNILCGLVLPRFYLLAYGSEVNGLISSITQFLGFIVFLEMGLGPVIQSNLYKPLAEKDTEQVSKIVVSAERFFRGIAGAFTLYIVLLGVFYPQIVRDEFDWPFTASLILIIAISSLVEYLFGAAYQLLLNADQMAYIQLNCHTITLILNALISIGLMHIGCGVHLVKLISSLIFVIRPLYFVGYVKQHYNLNMKIKFKGEPIQQKWNGVFQHIAAVVNQNADVAILTLVSTLQNVSIYSVYYTIVMGMERIVMTVAIGLEAMWGNMIARGEKETLVESFRHVEWLVHVAVTFLFTITAIVITSFVDVYTMGVNDADYHLPIFGALLTLAYALECYRIPYSRMIKASGHYKQTQWAALIQPILNILVSVVLVKYYGLNGVVFGTIISMLYHTMYLARYTSKKLLGVKLGPTIKLVFADALSIILIYSATRWIAQEATNYVEWAMNALFVTMVASACLLAVNLILYPHEIKKYIYKLKK